MCYRYAIANDQKTFATGIRKWSKHLTEFSMPKFTTLDCVQQWQSVLVDIYSHLCLVDVAFKTMLINTGPRPFTLHCMKPWGCVPNDPDICPCADLINDILVNVHVLTGEVVSLSAGLWTTGAWGEPLFADGRIFPFYIAGMVSGCAEWPIPSLVEFMIDTGCQVTILSTTVFDRMCTLDPRVSSELRPCRRRLVSADSSPLVVQGELESSVVFPGLCCDMLFVVANIGSDGLLGTEALQSYIPHQLDLRTGQLWAEGCSTLQLHQQRLAPELDGFLTTSVVLPPVFSVFGRCDFLRGNDHGGPR